MTEWDWVLDGSRQYLIEAAFWKTDGLVPIPIPIAIGTIGIARPTGALLRLAERNLQFRSIYTVTIWYRFDNPNPDPDSLGLLGSR